MSAAPLTDDPVLVTVAMLTYLRPDDIAAVLPLVLEQARDVESAPVAGLSYRVQMLVVDNDPEGSAAGLVGRVSGVLYRHEPRPGIAHARNRALDEATDVDLLVFLDDDERPRAGWLRALLRTRSETGAAVVAGRVVSEFKVQPDAWVLAGGFFRRRSAATGSPIKVAATNNLLLDLSLVREVGVRFDPRFGLTGGEDTLFTRTLHARGAKMVWCDEAVVTDMVPAERATRRAVLRRAMSMGTKLTRTDLELAVGPTGRCVARVRGGGRGLIRLLAGASLSLLGAATGSQRLVARGSRTAARGLGMGAAAFGYRHQEYRRKGPTVQPRVRVYEVIRSAHLERAHELAPATIFYTARRYDFDPALATGLDLRQTNAATIACTLLRSPVRFLEVNEPLQRSGLVLAFAAVLATRVRTLVRGGPCTVGAYAIENRDPFVPRRGRLRSRVRCRLDFSLARQLAARLDRLAFGTSASAVLYESRFGRQLASMVTNVVPALPARCGCSPLTDDPDRSPQVAFVGAWQPRKGLPQLLAAWPLVRRSVPSAGLTILGQGGLEDDVRTFALEHPDVRVLTDPPRAQVHRLLSEVDVLVLLSQPTSTWREQVGLPIVEGLAHGCTVVTTDQTGLAPWLRDHGHVVLASGATTQETADALVKSLAARRPRASVLGDLPSIDGRLSADAWMAGPTAALS